MVAVARPMSRRSEVVLASIDGQIAVEQLVRALRLGNWRQAANCAELARYYFSQIAGKVEAE